MKTINAYILELKRLIQARTGVECEPWLYPQIRAAAANMVILDKVQAEIESTASLVTLMYGSTGQQKSEVNPLLGYYDKMQRTLMMQFEALGLNYKTTPSKVKEDTKRGVDENDGLVSIMTGTKKQLEDMDGFINP